MGLFVLLANHAALRRVASGNLSQTVFTPLNLALIAFELVVLVLVISVHDCAQAWAANRLGDPTARMLGRLTLNPAKHYNAWGMAISPLLAVFLFANPLPFGWGAPVPMTYRNFRNKYGETLALLAGPAAQVLVATLSLVGLLVLKHTVSGVAESIDAVVPLVLYHVPVVDLSALPSIFPVLLLLYMLITMNLLLCILNFFPLPFFDGGRILAYFLPYNAAQAFERYSMYFVFAFFLLARPLTMLFFSPLLAIFNALLQGI
jgi:Zn-dependent protease